MSVLLICPACEYPHSLHRLPVAPECSRCGATYPANAREVAAQTLLAEVTPRPFLLTLGMGFMAFWSAVASLMTVVTLVSSAGSYTINGQQVTREEFLREPMVMLFPVAIVCTAVLAWGLFEEKAWTRPLMMLVWVAYIVMVAVAPWPSPADRAVTIGLAVMCAGIAGWYLYVKSNVVAYFQRLVRKSATSTA